MVLFGEQLLSLVPMQADFSLRERKGEKLSTCVILETNRPGDEAIVKLSYETLVQLSGGL